MHSHLGIKKCHLISQKQQQCQWKQNLQMWPIHVQSCSEVTQQTRANTDKPIWAVRSCCENTQAFPNISPQADLKTDTISHCTKVQLWQKCPLWPRVLRSVHIRSAATCEINHVTTRWACVSVSNVHTLQHVHPCGIKELCADSCARSGNNSSVKSHNLDKWIVCSEQDALKISIPIWSF